MAQLDDLARTQAAYQRVFGDPAPAYRFPYLAETPTMMSALAREGIAVFSIDLGITDWQPEDTTPILVDRLTRALEGKPGGIILMHDANEPTVAALPSLLRTLKDKGFKLIHIDWEK
jgi:peptidoglycan/xylan/chitin deacetylase (PgdA/CDA1 family)